MLQKPHPIFEMKLFFSCSCESKVLSMRTYPLQIETACSRTCPFYGILIKAQFQPCQPRIFDLALGLGDFDPSFPHRMISFAI